MAESREISSAIIKALVYNEYGNVTQLLKRHSIYTSYTEECPCGTHRVIFSGFESIIQGAVLLDTLKYLIENKCIENRAIAHILYEMFENVQICQGETDFDNIITSINYLIDVVVQRKLVYYSFTENGVVSNLYHVLCTSDWSRHMKENWLVRLMDGGIGTCRVGEDKIATKKLLEMCGYPKVDAKLYLLKMNFSSDFNQCV